MESDYVRESVGSALALGLAEVALIRPHDPVEYLGLWLLKHKQNLAESEERKKIKTLEMTALAQTSQPAKVATQEETTQQPIEQPTTTDQPIIEDTTTAHTTVATNEGGEEATDPAAVTEVTAVSSGSRQGSRPTSRLSRIEEEIAPDTTTLQHDNNDD